MTGPPAARGCHRWSAKKQILGKDVYNDAGEKIGDINDLIVAPSRAVSYAIVGVGGFLGMGEHNVAVPVSKFKQTIISNLQRILGGRPTAPVEPVRISSSDRIWVNVVVTPGTAMASFGTASPVVVAR